MTRCSSCGVLNDEDAVFCASCHHFLEWSVAPKAKPAPVPQPSREPTAPKAPATPLPADSQPPPEPPSPNTVSVRDDPRRALGVGELVAAIDEGRAIARERQRPDLAEQLSQAQQRLESGVVTAVVVGEFKRGKSTLINALIQTAVCPVDADIVTAVPTLVRYGDRVGLTSYEQSDSDAEPVAQEHSLASITSLVSESPLHAPTKIRSVEVRVPHRILRSGLCLLDTPGVGGLDSVHGQITLGSLSSADSLLFVTDAAQELTAPEMEFLKTALARCSSAALVVTKTDLYPQWRRIVELDEAHLADAGIELPVIAVSSFLRLRATHQPALNAESGFAPLVQFLATAVVVPGAARAAATAAHDVDFVASQLAHESDAERVVLVKPEESELVVKQLNRASKKALGLTSASATWQQTLADGIQDLVADVEHDLQSRLRTVLRDVEEVIDEGDPRDMWPDTEAWLRRQVAAAGVANHDLLVARAQQLSEEVAEEFDLEAGTGIELELDNVTRALEALQLASASSVKMPGGRLGPMVMAARISFLVPMMVFEFGVRAFSDLPVLPMAGVAASLGAGIGGKLFKNEGQRQRSYRQQSAKTAARKFVDEVAFVMNKETRDSLRRTQRLLRADLQSRATVIHRSTTAAMDAAQRAAQLAPREQSVRSEQLTAESERLQSIRSTDARVRAHRCPFDGHRRPRGRRGGRGGLRCERGRRGAGRQRTRAGRRGSRWWMSSPGGYMRCLTMHSRSPATRSRRQSSRRSVSGSRVPCG